MPKTKIENIARRTLRFPKQLSNMVQARGSELLVVDFDCDYMAFLEVAEPILRFFVEEEARWRSLPSVGPDIVEIDLVTNLGAFEMYSYNGISSDLGLGPTRFEYLTPTDKTEDDLEVWPDDLDA